MLIDASPPDVVVLDRDLPGLHGDEVCRRVVEEHPATRVIMLTASGTLDDRLEGFDLGADDYLPKPFAMEELLARVRALLRRTPSLQSTELAHGGLRIAPEAGCMAFGEKVVTLSHAELQMIVCLVRAKGQTVRRHSLEQAAWGLMDAVTPNAFDVAMHRLRKKLAAVGCDLALVNTRGHGFALRTTDVAD